MMAYYAEQEGVDLNDRSDANRDARQGVYIKAQKEIAKLISYEEWKEIRKGPAGKIRLKEMGLPTTYAEAAALGIDNFGPTPQEQEVAEAKETFDASTEVQEEKDVFGIVVEDAADAGKSFVSPEAAQKYVKTWFRDNIPDGVYDDETLTRLQRNFGDVLYKTYPADPVEAEKNKPSEDLQLSPDEFGILESIKSKG